MELKVAEYFTKEDGSTPLYVTQRNFMSGYSTFILVRNTPFKASLDHFILAFHETSPSSAKLPLLTTSLSELIAGFLSSLQSSSAHHRPLKAHPGLLAVAASAASFLADCLSLSD
ncbi:hypothetical protein E2C01_022047 [Portunus trituberculatus]|uniref:Uncharacterized protein n=1 Tax=Portunus trituberculatus TaxID=210409 RepID=A0A5B7E6J3_PORTR|nr:hypothetical protein [Portunus trituberculatus]